MPKLLLLLCLLCVSCSVSSVVKEKSRQKRAYLIWPDRTRVQLIAGTGVPVKSETGQTMTVGWVIKAAFLEVNNATVLTTILTNPYVTFQKRDVSRGVSRYDLYSSFENAAYSFGGGGKECLLRAICEAAQTPLLASGIIGRLLHVFLTPSSTEEPPLHRHHLEYHSAERMGRQQETPCENIYTDCDLTVMDLVTEIM